MFRKYEASLNALPCNLLICDEGHRLKGNASGAGLTLDALWNVQTKRRIIVTGTPIQNDLEVSFECSRIHF